VPVGLYLGVGREAHWVSATARLAATSRRPGGGGGGGCMVLNPRPCRATVAAAHNAVDICWSQHQDQLYALSLYIYPGFQGLLGRSAPRSPFSCFASPLHCSWTLQLIYGLVNKVCTAANYLSSRASLSA